MQKISNRDFLALLQHLSSSEYNGKGSINVICCKMTRNPFPLQQQQQ